MALRAAAPLAVDPSAAWRPWVAAAAAGGGDGRHLHELADELAAAALTASVSASICFCWSSSDGGGGRRGGPVHCRHADLVIAVCPAWPAWTCGPARPCAPPACDRARWRHNPCPGREVLAACPIITHSVFIRAISRLASISRSFDGELLLPSAAASARPAHLRPCPAAPAA